MRYERRLTMVGGRYPLHERDSVYVNVHVLSRCATFTVLFYEHRTV